MTHDYVRFPGPLHPRNVRENDDGTWQMRWLCSCGATGNWFEVHPDRVNSLMVDMRRRSAHYNHVKREEKRSQ